MKEKWFRLGVKLKSDEYIVEYFRVEGDAIWRQMEIERAGEVLNLSPLLEVKIEETTVDV